MFVLSHLNALEDGPCDMAVAYSDRIVRLFQWIPGKPSDERTGKLILLIKWELAGQVSSKLSLIFFKISRICLHSTPTMSNLVSLVCITRCPLYLDTRFTAWWWVCFPSEKIRELRRSNVVSSHLNDNSISPTLVYHPPKLTPNQNMEMRTWIVGGLKSNLSGVADYLIGLCLADGTVHLLSADLQKSGTIWSVSLPVNGELFGLSKFDLTVN